MMKFIPYHFAQKKYMIFTLFGGHFFRHKFPWTFAFSFPLGVNNVNVGVTLPTSLNQTPNCSPFKRANG